MKYQKEFESVFFKDILEHLRPEILISGEYRCSSTREKYNAFVAGMGFRSNTLTDIDIIDAFDLRFIRFKPGQKPSFANYVDILMGNNQVIIHVRISDIDWDNGFEIKAWRISDGETPRGDKKQSDKKWWTK